MKLMILPLLFALNAWGQTSTQSSVQAAPQSSTIHLPKNKKFEDSHEITDAKLRADVGSMSRYSFKFDLTYMGASLATPLAKEQPNPDGMRRVTATSMTGSISGRIRLDPTASIFLGTGLSALHPFHGTDRWDVKNPSVGYDVFDRLGDFQMRLSSSVSMETVPDYIQAGVVGGAGLTGSLVRDFGTSGFAGSMDALGFYRLYNRDYEKQDGVMTRYVLILSPGVKFNFSDNFSLSTNLMKALYNPRSVRDESILLPQSLTQRISLGYAFTKDIYVSPFVSIYPEKFAWDRTTLNIAGVFSVL